MAGTEPKKGGPGVSINVAALKAARERKGWSQKELAKRVGCDPRNIERAESSGRTSIKTLKEIADALGADPESFRQLTPTPHSAREIDRRFQLPAVVADFTGREDEFQRMADRLRGEGGAIGLSALRGMGGVGKTSLAVKVAHTVKDHYPDAQLILDLQGVSDRPVTAVEAMSRVIRDFHPDVEKLPDTKAELLPQYRSVLNGKRALIVLDNAKDEDQVKSLVTAPPPVGFIVTSRNALELDGVDSIRLDVLPMDEACQLLRGIVGGKGTDDKLRAVAGLCGRLPLALRVAGDFLRLHANWSVERYIAALKDESQRLGRLKGKTKEKDVEAVLGLSAAELVRSNPERAERWQMLAVFPADFDSWAAATVWDLKAGEKLDIETAVDELTDLLDRSLVQFDESTGRYSLHDLMRPVARDTFEYVDNHPLHAGSAGRLRTAEQRFAVHYRTVLATANDLYTKGNDNILRGLALFDREEANIRCGQQWAAQHWAQVTVATSLCHNYHNAGANILDLRLPVQERIGWVQQALEACRQLHCRRCEGNALGSLGIEYGKLGRMEMAIDHLQRRLLIAREIGDREGEAAALCNLGIACVHLGRMEEAINHYQQSLTIAREMGYRRSEGSTLGNLGVAYANLGRMEEAIDHYQQDLIICREMGNRRGEGVAHGNLANVYTHLGRVEEAIGRHQQSLAIAREIRDQQQEENALGNLGNAYRNLGRVEEAIRHYQQALVISREIGDRRGEANSIGSLGLAYMDLGRGEEAIEHYQQSLVISREIGDRRGEGNGLGNLGLAYANLGRVAEAIEDYQQRLVIAREIGDRQGEANTSGNLALALDTLGDRPGAIRSAEHALLLHEAIKDPAASKVRRQLAEWRGETAPDEKA